MAIILTNWSTRGLLPFYLIMLKSGIALMTLLVPKTSNFAFAELNDMDMSTLSKRGLLDFEHKVTSYAFDLMHIHHMDSRHAPLNLTLSQSIQLLMKDDKERRNHLAHEYSRKHGRLDMEQEHHHVMLPLIRPRYKYLLQIGIGEKERKLPIILDTGSILSWVRCLPCDDCNEEPKKSPQHVEHFDPSSSSSYIPMPYKDPMCTSYRGLLFKPFESKTHTCEYHQSYIDDSTSHGVMAYDFWTFFGHRDGKEIQGSVNVTFGCSRSVVIADYEVAGLMGLARGPDSMPWQLKEYVFSYCLVDFRTNMFKKSSFYFGKRDVTYTIIPLSDLSNRQQYYIGLTGILVDNQILISSRGKTIGDPVLPVMIDSGQHFSTFPETIYTPLEQAIWLKMVGFERLEIPDDDFLLCYNMAGHSDPKYPTVIFKFDQKSITLPPNNLFVQSGVDHHICLALLLDPLTHLRVPITFGAAQQQTMEVLYDNVNHQMGFAEAQC